MGDQPLTHGERETLERLARLSQRYVGGLVPLEAISSRRADLERLVACGRARRLQGTGPLSRAENLVHVYYAPEPEPAEAAGRSSQPVR
ncbi:MAG TPA: hypothetical protein VGO78_15255 [Acidimicrobiales bacterium]|jgi:hypothetical protein|nr:hypothetical protein [Acidimicrobiales bacterium]